MMRRLRHFALLVPCESGKAVVAYPATIGTSATVFLSVHASQIGQEKYCECISFYKREVAVLIS